MKIYSYVLRKDRGFAPNPYWGYCTLACCKPVIRKVSKVNDWVIGTGSVENVGINRLIYAMKITEKLTFEQYSLDERFQNKIPKEGVIEERGDNIYFKDEDGKWRQRCPSYHSLRRKNGKYEEDAKMKEHDLKGKCVLISNHFLYFGRKAVEIPKEFKVMIKTGPAHKSIFNEKIVNDFVNWLESLSITGRMGNPYDFKQRLSFPE